MEKANIHVKSSIHQGPSSSEESQRSSELAIISSA